MNTALNTHASTESNEAAYYAGFQCLAARFQSYRRDLQLKLAGSRAGRVALHAAVALKSGRYGLHFQGIARELSRH